MQSFIKIQLRRLVHDTRSIKLTIEIYSSCGPKIKGGFKADNPASLLCHRYDEARLCNYTEINNFNLLQSKFSICISHVAKRLKSCGVNQCVLTSNNKVMHLQI